MLLLLTITCSSFYLIYILGFTHTLFSLLLSCLPCSHLLIVLLRYHLSIFHSFPFISLYICLIYVYQSFLSLYHFTLSFFLCLHQLCWLPAFNWLVVLNSLSSISSLFLCIRDSSLATPSPSLLHFLRPHLCFHWWSAAPTTPNLFCKPWCFQYLIKTRLKHWFKARQQWWH